MHSTMALMSWGMWVARCPRVGCVNAEKRGRCDDGTQGGLSADRFACRASHGGCGLMCGVDWPRNIAEIEALLLSRPIPATRNWSPGESLTDLMHENLAHGIVPVHGLEIVGSEISSRGVLEFAPARELEMAGWRG